MPRLFVAFAFQNSSLPSAENTATSALASGSLMNALMRTQFSAEVKVEAAVAGSVAKIPQTSNTVVVSPEKIFRACIFPPLHGIFRIVKGVLEGLWLGDG